MLLIEKEILLKNNYVFGRTNFDFKYALSVNEKIKYFKIEEYIRPDFFNKEIQIYKKKKILTFSCTISENIYKGIDTIIRLLKLFEEFKIDYRFKLIGIKSDSLIYKFFRKKYRFNHDHKLEFLGHLNSSEIVNELQSSDIFFHPSYIDNSPNSVCESQLLGLPTICFDVGGISSLVKNNHNGFLINSNHLFDIIYLLKHKFNDVEFINELKINAYNDAHVRHDPDKISKSILLAYDKILDNQL